MALTKIQINGSFVHCKPVPDYIEVPQNTDVVVVADEGFIFKETNMPRIVYDQYASHAEYKFDKITENGKKAIFNNYFNDGLHNVQITATAYESGVTHGKQIPVITKLTNCTANSDLPTQVEVGKTLSVTLTASAGYKFDAAKSTPNFSYNDESYNAIIKNFTISEDGATATGEIVMGNWDDFQIRGTAYTIPTPVKKVAVTTSLTDCTANSDLPNEVEVGQTLSVTLTANTGHIFDKAKSVPVFSYSDENAVTKEQPFTISENGKTATGEIVMGDYSNFVIKGTAYTQTTPVKKVAVTTALTNCTANADLPTEVEVGQTLRVTLTANENNKFDATKSTPYFSYTNENLDPVEKKFTISSDNRTATGEVVMGDWEDFTITGIAYTQTTPVKKVEVTPNLSNCTANSDLPSEVEVGQTLKVTLTANENTKFDATKSTPHFSYQDEHLDFKTQNLTISEDNLTATGEIVMGDWDLFTIEGEAYPVAVVGGKYGAVNVYLVTNDNLNEFSTKRFFRVTGTDPETGAAIYENVDLGDYVNKIVRIYTPIKASSTDVIRCGNYNTKIKCYQPETDKITLDFGDVTIPNHNKNNVDFESDVQIFLPFLGFVNVPNDYIGKTINLQYVINVLTGNASALISCDGVIFQVEETEPKTNVLYLSQNTESKTIGGDDWNERLFYGIEPYVLLKWFNSLGEGLNNDRKSGNIGSFTGFSRFDDVEPISAENMLIEEQKQIYDLLSSGVYVE